MRTGAPKRIIGSAVALMTLLCVLPVGRASGQVGEAARIPAPLTERLAVQQPRAALGLIVTPSLARPNEPIRFRVDMSGVDDVGLGAPAVRVMRQDGKLVRVYKPNEPARLPAGVYLAQAMATQQRQALTSVRIPVRVVDLAMRGPRRVSVGEAVQLEAVFGGESPRMPVVFLISSPGRPPDALETDEQTASHRFEQSGTYQVRAIVQSGKERLQSEPLAIQVVERPPPNPLRLQLQVPDHATVGEPVELRAVPSVGNLPADHVVSFRIKPPGGEPSVFPVRGGTLRHVFEAAGDHEVIASTSAWRATERQRIVVTPVRRVQVRVVAPSHELVLHVVGPSEPIQLQDPVAVEVEARLDGEPIALPTVTYEIKGAGGFRQRYENLPARASFPLPAVGFYTVVAHATLGDGIQASGQARIEVIASPPPPPPPPRPRAEPLPAWIVLTLLALIMAGLLGAFRVSRGRWPWQSAPTLRPTSRATLVDFRDPPRIEWRLTFRAIEDPGRQTILPPSSPAPALEDDHERADRP